MRQIALKDLQSIELDILISFTNFCNSKGYKYFLCGGTLIGALRHKGFIPWDDDIDIMMPRDDYTKALKEYYHEFYKVDSVSINEQSHVRYARVCDSRTLLRTNQKEKYMESVFIDVFPMDGLPNSDIGRKLLIYLQQVLIACHLASVLKFGKSNRYADRDGGTANWRSKLRTIFKCALISLLGHTEPSTWGIFMNKIAMMEKYDNHEYVGVTISGPHGTKEIMKATYFSDRVKLDFEGHCFYAPVGYDQYLRQLYGDYMKMPQVSKRRSHHSFEAWWR